jgi:hypothetical protein
MGDRTFTGMMMGAGVLSASIVAFLTMCSGPRPAPPATVEPVEATPAQDTAGTGPAASEDPDDPFELHVATLAKKVPPGFSIVIQKPFVVIGDESPKNVEKRAQGTVKTSVDALKNDYFEKDPPHIIDIWLFRDATSYEKHAKLLFGHEPDTPYGYYSETEQALIMNIATGGGTLVHEIVHPFMAANFPACPAWFNEGLGSLYEQCQFDDGHLMGMTNWRLAGLQEAIKEGAVPTFAWLTSRNDDQFYGQDPGTNYAQSRYLLYYLQEQGLLVDYYHDFVEASATDPSGFKTLGKVLGEDDMEDFQRRWEKWVLGLKFG